MSAPPLPLPPALGPHESREVFRALLNALAQPGTVGQLALPDDGTPAALLVPLALAEVDVTVTVLDAPDRRRHWEGALTRATDARPAELAQADVVVALDRLSPDDVRRLRRGTSLAPEDGARLVIFCSRLAGVGPAELRLTLAGPGVSGQKELWVDGVEAHVVEALIEANASFPLGVDTFFVAADGALAGVPRTSRIQVQQEAAWATPR